ncbi:MAG: 1-deoxy-D-xylulose-5-phosphate reductoisomerase [Elusimicrobia bacterium]|nr:1-deoxy-D-xylulose-5-phosphate reductoisomerase [Elusimicrobiota bacterium]
MKKVCVLGSTGSVGKQTLKIIRTLKDVKISILCAHSNYKLLLKQAEEFGVKKLCLTDRNAYLKLPYSQKKIFFSPDEIERIFEHDFDILFVASAGSTAIKLIYKALKLKKTVAIANKEAIVMAGDILIKEAKKEEAKIIPVDSEHSALFQILENFPHKAEGLTITSSGGAIAGANKKSITPQVILRHPVWKMGAKITVDSSTGMNKGLEVIEAHHLFSFPFEKISVILHREAIVHGIVEFKDGSSIAYLSPPTMEIPIKYALTYPEKTFLPEKLNYKNLKFSFEKFPEEKYPCFSLALYAGKKGGIYPSVLCGANETAVQHFLKGKISFYKISQIIEKVLAKTPKIRYSIDGVLEAEKWAKSEAMRFV